jgi:hypothetical protein
MPVPGINDLIDSTLPTRDSVRMVGNPEVGQQPRGQRANNRRQNGWTGVPKCRLYRINDSTLPRLGTGVTTGFMYQLYAPRAGSHRQAI